MGTTERGESLVVQILARLDPAIRTCFIPIFSFFFMTGVNGAIAGSSHAKNYRLRAKQFISHFPYAIGVFPIHGKADGRWLTHPWRDSIGFPQTDRNRESRSRNCCYGTSNAQRTFHADVANVASTKYISRGCARRVIEFRVLC